MLAMSDATPAAPDDRLGGASLEVIDLRMDADRAVEGRFGGDGGASGSGSAAAAFAAAEKAPIRTASARASSPSADAS